MIRKGFLLSTCLLLAIPAGHLSDRVSRRLVMLLLFGGTAGATALIYGAR